LQETGDVAVWNTMIAGYGEHGNGKKAVETYKKLLKSGLKPDNITFLSLLNACAHSGLTDQALSLYASMAKFEIAPTEPHITCVIDALARKGQLEEAEQMLNTLVNPSVIPLSAVLGACRVFKDVVRAERVGQKALELFPKDPSLYVILGNTYAGAGRFEEANKTRERMVAQGIAKSPGKTSVEINTRVYTFYVSDTTHPDMNKIEAKWNELEKRLLGLYEPDTSWVLQDMTEENKRLSLCHHSERIALCYALINTKPGEPIYMTKNLRICGDCHTVVELISKLEQRLIVVRDARRFHHFVDGKCSCGGFY